MMDAAHAELLLKGASQAAPDIPGMGIHARPAAMSKTGFMLDLRDNHVRAVSLAMTKASLQAECRHRGVRANNGETKDIIHARLLASDTNDLDQADWLDGPFDNEHLGDFANKPLGELLTTIAQGHRQARTTSSGSKSRTPSTRGTPRRHEATFSHRACCQVPPVSHL
jgi:hypothetical protein